MVDKRLGEDRRGTFYASIMRDNVDRRSEPPNYVPHYETLKEFLEANDAPVSRSLQEAPA